MYLQRLWMFLKYNLTVSEELVDFSFNQSSIFYIQYILENLIFLSLQMTPLQTHSCVILLHLLAKLPPPPIDSFKPHKF